MVARKMRLGLAALAVFLSVMAPANAASASDPLGTAGKFRTIMVGNCDKPMLERLRGACDPPPVDPGLPLSEQVEAHLARARRLVALIRMEQARAAADSAVALDPTNVAALKFRARLAATMMDGRTALNDVNRALDLAPGDSDLLATRAELRWGKNQLAPALQDAMAAVKANPKSVDALFTKARVLMSMGRLRDAVTELDAALEIDPDYVPSRTLRAQLELRLTDFDEAISDADRILQAQPVDISALEVRAMSRFALGRLGEAVDDLSGILGKPGDRSRPTPFSPERQALLLQRAIILIQLKRNADAEADLDTMLNAGGVRAVLRLQIFLRRNGFPDVALDGKRSAEFERSLYACFVQKSCWSGLTWRI